MSGTDGLTFILALPYSGSSLFALALGNAEGFVNCGEINYLEKDYHDHRICSCGALLADCPFWGPLIARAQARAAEGGPMVHFTSEAGLHPIYSRHATLRQRLGIMLGRDARRIYDEQSLDTHLSEQLEFMRLVLEHTGAREIVDASKNPRRLMLLMQHQQELPVRVIVLSRRSAAALGARIKRARRRTRWYRQIFAPIYIMWLLVHYIQMGRVVRNIPHDRILRVAYEDFVRDPGSVEKRLSDWYGRPVAFDRIGEKQVNMADVHVYTGNTWLTRGAGRAGAVTLRPPAQAYELTRFERAQLRVFTALFPMLRTSS